ncbi:hypothetical protein C8Q80DRAFT_1274150 [Daedaleopsis nitida]|nr:hypothetical protein C8Q80DRAFT_1274150 [Daedaleopsis nitida]
MGDLPDVILVAQDQTPLYVHSRRLLHASTNGWGGMLTSATRPIPVDVAEDAATTQVVLHLVYGLSCLRLSPSFETTENALAALIKYGVAVCRLATLRTPLYHLVLTHAPFHPVETYALAGQYNMDAIAVATSAHLLTFDASTLSNHLVVQMGAVYLKRLLCSHESRCNALKAIVLLPPRMHRPTKTCGRRDQDALTTAWAHAVSGFAWASDPGLSTRALRSVFEKDTAAMLSCDGCRAMLEQRIQQVTMEWIAVKRTI